MQKWFKILLPILFAITILLGLVARSGNPFRFDSNVALQKNTRSDQSLEAYYEESKRIANQPAETTTTFLATGDIMLSRTVAQKIKEAGNPLLPFLNIEPLLASTDFNFANLESPLSGSNAFNGHGSLVFNVPPANAEGLSRYNFRVLNLANNHAFDQSKNGLLYTQHFLSTKRIVYVGVGENKDVAWQGKIITSNGIKLGFIGASYASANDGGKATNDFVARIEDKQKLRESIQQLKLQADFIVVTMHAGTEYTKIPNQAQIDFAHAAIELGADIVIGAHPHWVQTIEKYCPTNSPPLEGHSALSSGSKRGARGGSSCKYIFYSLGNFIFDQEWSKETKEGLTLKITVTSGKQAATKNQILGDDLQGSRIPAQIKQIELIPVVLENYCCPRVANNSEATAILNKIAISNAIINP